MRRANKYGAIRTTLDGLTFDSKGEAARWAFLRMMERSGFITGLRRQVPVGLHAPSCLDGTLRVVGKYVMDFAYFPKGAVDANSEVWEDFKSPATITGLFNWKRRHIEIEYGKKLRVVRRPTDDVA